MFVLAISALRACRSGLLRCSRGVVSLLVHGGKSAMKLAHVAVDILSNGARAVKHRFEWYFNGTQVSTSEYPVGFITKATFDVPENTHVRLDAGSIDADGNITWASVEMQVGAAPPDPPLPPEPPTLGAMQLEYWFDQ